MTLMRNKIKEKEKKKKIRRKMRELDKVG